MAILAVNCFNWMIQNLYMETCSTSAQVLHLQRRDTHLGVGFCWMLEKDWQEKHLWSQKWGHVFFLFFFQFFRLFLEDEGASNSFLAVCSATGRRSTNASSRKTRPEARRFVNTNLQHKLKNRGKFNYPKNAWTLQWKGEWTCISQGCFGVLKMTPLDWGGNRILRVLYFPNLKYIRRFLGGFPVLNDLFVWFICPERLFFFSKFQPLSLR